MTDLSGEFGRLPPAQRDRYHMFAAAFFVLIGSHVASRPARLAEFQHLVGFVEEPSVQMWLPAFMFAVLVAYNTVQSLCPSPRVFVACVSLAYGAASLAVSLPSLLVDWEALCPGAAPAEAVATAPCVPVAVGGARRAAGGMLYLVSETRGVLLPPMFWSVLSDTSSVEASRCAYVYVVLMGNLGGIVGSMAVMFCRSTGLLLAAQAAALVLFTLLMWRPLSPGAAGEQQGQVELASSSDEGSDNSVADAEGAEPRATSTIVVLRKETYKMALEGVQGLVLIASKPHVAGILVVSWAFILPRSVLDFQGSYQLSRVFEERHEKMAFLGRYNLCASVLTCLLAAFGTSALIKRLTPAVVILILPCVLALAVVAYTAHMTLATINVVLLLANLAERAINTSAREMLYISTSKDIKYKAKSWGDVYGNSLLKMAASVFNMSVNVPSYDGGVTVPCMLLWCTAWFCVALRVGRVNSMLEATGKLAS